MDFYFKIQQVTNAKKHSIVTLCAGDGFSGAKTLEGYKRYVKKWVDTIVQVMNIKETYGLYAIAYTGTSKYFFYDIQEDNIKCFDSWYEYVTSSFLDDFFESF